MHGFKSAILPELKIAKMALLNLCMEFKKNLSERLLLKHYEDDIYKKYP